MSKKTAFPELVEYFAQSYYDEFVGEYSDHSFIRLEDLEKSVLSESDQKLVDSNICHRCKNNLRTEGRKDDYYSDEIVVKICGTCGNIVVDETKIVKK